MPSLRRGGVDMWGMLVRIQGARVDASVPGWLMNAAASQVAIDQIKRVAYELAARPDDYGFDPEAIYSVFFQTWDRSSTSLRSVAFGRDVGTQPAVGLLPDPYYMHARGYRTLYRVASTLPAWADRSDLITWRGSVTGDNSIALPQDLPRIRLAMVCRDMPGLDIGLIGVHSTMNNGREPGLLDGFVHSHGLIKDRWDMSEFGRHKYTVDIDGHANAWGFLEKLIVGCCVLKVASPYEQWFYDRIKPWHHYVPVNGDLSDLVEVAEWCRANEAQCQWIAQNGAKLAASLTLERELPAMCKTVLGAAHARQSNGAPNRISVPNPRFLLEDAAAVAEDRGRLNQAIAAYTSLIDAGEPRWEILMRRHDLLRQRGDFAAAQADMEAAIIADPTNDEPPLRLAQFFALLGRHVSAVTFFARARALAPYRVEIPVALASSCLKLEWLDQAFWAVRALPADLPGWWADVRRETMTLYRAARARALALMAAARLMPGLLPEHRWELTLLLNKLGRTRAAQHVFKALPPNFPSQNERLTLTRSIRLRRSGPANALDYLKRLQDDLLGIAPEAMTSMGLLFEQGAYRPILERAAQNGFDEAEAPLLEIVACSAAMEGRLAELTASCATWMERSPHDYGPAELLCGAHPVVDIPPEQWRDRPIDFEIGQFWADVALPGPVQTTMNSWIEHHRNAHHTVYNDESARAFLLTHYGPEMVQAFDLCNQPFIKARYFRFAWLFQTGGCWVASDQRCIRSAARTLAFAADSDMVTVRSGHIKGYLQDSFLAARSGSKLIESAITVATEEILGTAARGEALWGWAAVGSGLLTKLAAGAICRDEHRSKLLLLAPMTYDSFATTVHFAT